MAKRPVPLYDFKAFGAAIKAARNEYGESRKKVSDELYISPRFLARQGKPEKGGGFFVGHGLCFWHNALKDRTPDDQPMAARPAFLLG